MAVYRIGVVGYSNQKFDTKTAYELLGLLIWRAVDDAPYGDQIEIVSGLTDVGIPAMAYRIAKVCGYKTAGISCAKAANYDCYPCDRVQIVGKDWGDESDKFLNQLHAIVRVGGGEYTHAEIARAKELPCGPLVYEADLEALPDFGAS